MLQIRLFEYLFQVSVVFLHILLYQFPVCLLREKRFKKQPVNNIAEERPSGSKALDMRKEHRAVGLLLCPKSNDTPSLLSISR